jgi:hypothetical protein
VSAKTYVLCRLGRIGSMEFEELMQACNESQKATLKQYAEQYHMDMMSDPEDTGYYRGLVIYECDGISEPYLAYSWGRE